LLGTNALAYFVSHDEEEKSFTTFPVGFAQGDQKIGRKFAQILGKVAQTVAKPNILTMCS
jgi:hypothetical protein